MGYFKREHRIDFECAAEVTGDVMPPVRTKAERKKVKKEELLVDKVDLTKTFVLRRILNPMGTTDAIEFLLGKLKQTKTNSEFFDSMNA